MLHLFNLHVDNYLSEVCNKGLLGCVERFKKAGSKTFKGSTCDINDVTNTISVVMKAALLAGGYIHLVQTLPFRKQSFWLKSRQKNIYLG
ncbi:hypothetical protein R6Q57_020331 [Mikania cordata]